MRKGDEQIGLPAAVYNDTKANIEALSGVVEGATAYATDTDEPGWYDGATWTWGAGGAGGGNETFTDVYASRPAAGNDGDLFLPSDGFVVERDTGAAWVPWGPLFPFTQPVDGDFAWVNQGAASVSTTNGQITMTVPAAASVSYRIREKAAPATPYSITACMLLSCYGANYAFSSLGFRDSATGKLEFWRTGWFTNNFSIGIITASSPTADVASLYSGYMPFPGVIFFRITDNGTNFIYSHSFDGQNFAIDLTRGRTTYLANPDRVWWGGDDRNNQDAYVTLLHWRQT